jgi:ribosomal-protein-alanine N-acetyltransferase
MNKPAAMDPEQAPDHIRIRRATPADLAALVAIERDSFAIPWTEASLAEELTGSEHSIMLVAETTEGAVVGYIGCWIVVDEGQINNIAVSPIWRRAGIGGALLAALLNKGRERGLKRYVLEVRPSNTAARRLYARFGFTDVGLRKGYYSDNHEDAIIMLKNETESLD